MPVPCATAPRVLVADDHPAMLDALRLLLKNEGIDMQGVTSPDAALDALRTAPFDLVLMDLNYTGDTTSGREGIDLLARVQEIDSLVPVVVMTGWGSVDLAVETMRRGVRDFVQKPWDNGQLLSTLRREAELGRERRRRDAAEQRELAEALQIQRQLLPQHVPAIAGWDFAASWKPASGVGGDCFDVLPFQSGAVAISIADVVGKGIPAALLMSNLQAAVRAFASDTLSPEALCARVNRVLCGNIADGRFISFFYCVLVPDTGQVAYSNAGHCQPLLIRENGAFERLDAGGPVLGVIPDAPYEHGSVVLGKSDRLVFYTDGITEARDDRDEEFGEARLIEAALAHRDEPAQSMQQALADAVSSFARGALQDDATLLVLAVDFPGQE
jgi:sigma-B regulation protein RsbU (phosphoserine phosphatase)